MSTPESQLRASDADRERVVERLRTHAGEGRLDVDELEERIDAALAARTVGELDVLMRDLPAFVPEPRPRERRRSRPRLPVFVAVMALLVGIWALTGMGYFWPIWPMLGWGLAFHKGGCFGARGRRRRGPPVMWLGRRV
jgi:hypothetical protein